MLEFKNPEENIELKRRLKVLDVERNEIGELSKLYVEDTILNDVKKDNLIKIDKNNLEKIIKMLIYPEFISPRQMVEKYAQELKKQVKEEYTEDDTLPVTDKALCVWSINDDYLGAVRVEGNRIIVNPEIYDIEFELKLEVIYKGYTAYRLVKAKLKGRGIEGNNPEDVVYELVKNIPSYLEKDYKLPVLEGSTFSLIGEENDAVIEDNTIKISKLKNTGDGRITLKAEYERGENSASVELYITVMVPYYIDTFNLEIEKEKGTYKEVEVNIESNNNKTLYVVAKEETKNFTITHENNNTKNVKVKILETEELHKTVKNKTEEFDITFDIYTDNTKQLLYGTEKVVINYHYGPEYVVEETKAELVNNNNQLDGVRFVIKNMLEVPLYPVLEEDNTDLNIYIFENYNGDIHIDVTEKNEILDNTLVGTMVYTFKVGIYLDNNYKNKLGTVEYTVYYTISSTDPID